MSGIVVTGANGQLGTSFRKLLPEATFLTRTDLDLTDLSALRRVLSRDDPDLVINCAAYTAVDRAEDEEELATLVNGLAVGEMASLCSSIGARFVTYSTDYVFGGVSDRPWVESDPCDPINAYGRSKLRGEELVAEHGGLVIRTSWVVSGTHPNFIATMLRLAQERELSVVNDQQGCPTMADDLAVATRSAIDSGASGGLHLANTGETAWFDFAREALRLAGLDPERIQPCGTSEFPTQAKRPAYSVLGSERRPVLGIADLPPWQESLPELVESLFNNGVVDRP